MTSDYPPVRSAQVLLIFLGIAIASAIARTMLSIVSGTSLPITMLALEPAFVWLLFGALSLAVIALARRFPIRRDRLARALSIHGVAYLGVSSTHTMLYLPFSHLVLFPDQPMDHVGPSIMANLRTDIFVYAGIVGAYYLRTFAFVGVAATRPASVQNEASRAADPAQLMMPAAASTPEGVMPSVAASAATPAYLTRIPIRDDGVVEFVDVASIERIEADGDYLRLFPTSGRPRMIRQSLGFIITQLDPQQFVRVHRSAIVNVRFIRELQPLFHGEFEARMPSGARVKVSRTYRGALLSVLGMPTSAPRRR